jgi:hypothetical protein
VLDNRDRTHSRALNAIAHSDKTLTLLAVVVVVTVVDFPEPLAKAAFHAPPRHPCHLAHRIATLVVSSSQVMSWLWRGFQSALFYYISCTPCAVRAQHRRTRQSNRRERKVLALGDPATGGDDHGGLYTRTLPLQMNPAWAEERDEGPIPRRKGDRSQKASESATRLNTGGQGSSFGGSSAETGTTLVGKSLDDDDPWVGRHKRYQRPDEVLWGIKARESSDRDDGHDEATMNYMIGKNPAVNDMHPPIVSTQPTSKEQSMWMFQPPPPAKVMAGKRRATKAENAKTGASERARRSRASSKARAEHLENTFHGFDEDVTYDPTGGPSISLQVEPSTPTGFPFYPNPTPPSPADITRSSSSRSTAGEKSTRKASSHRPPLSTINSETNNVPRWLHPADAEMEQMESFRFPPLAPTMDVWRSEWDDIEQKDRDVSMRWSMDV